MGMTRGTAQVSTRGTAQVSLRSYFVFVGWWDEKSIESIPHFS